MILDVKSASRLIESKKIDGQMCANAQKHAALWTTLRLVTG